MAFITQTVVSRLTISSPQKPTACSGPEIQKRDIYVIKLGHHSYPLKSQATDLLLLFGKAAQYSHSLILIA